MTNFTTKNDYLEQQRKMFDQAGKEREELIGYLDVQFLRLNQLTEMISNETFWTVFPEVLGIDAKLVLLSELISSDDLTNEEILRMVEKDYLYYFKELCGYSLEMDSMPSMIFNVL